MNEENHELVGRAMNITLCEILAPYIAIELSSRYKENWWRDGVLNFLYEEQKRNLPSGGTFGELVDSLDVQRCLLLIDIHWREIFSKKLSLNHLNWVRELKNIRNQWAHTDWKVFDDSYTARALDTMARLCEQLDDENTDKLRDMWREKVYGSIEGSTSGKVVAEKEIGKKSAQGILQRATGNLKSWRKVIYPHPDVAEGRYRQAEFAADLAQVARGEGSPEYLDPIEFFSRTYITAGLNGLLQQALQRLINGNGEPVIQLKTSFGGGKTHSMLALYHLFNKKIRPEKSENVRKILTESGVENIPKDINVAVVVGTQFNPAKSRRPPNMPGITINTIWGEIAAQLAFSAGEPELYNYVKESDKKGVSPGSDTLRQFFDDCGACLILIDELVAYGKKIYGIDGMPSGSFDNLITFVQELTEAARASRRTMVVASLPESDIEVGGTAGKEILTQIEHTFGRMESIWKPVTANESFEVVRRRLFLNCRDENARDETCNAFSEMYRSNPGEFPIDTKDLSYKQRMIDCYPIHPEFFDYLYNKWATIEHFQKTRGVLRLMAGVIYYLWINKDSSCMIMPGSIPICISKIRDELSRYLPENWNAIIDSEIDGKDSIPFSLDKTNARFGEFMATRRTARTIFLGSAPTVRGQSNRGIYARHILLGVLQPNEGESISVFSDALSKLKSNLSYLYSDETGTRFWYDNRPTLRKLVQDLEQSISDESVTREIEIRLHKWRAQSYFAGVHICPESSDVPDEQTVRLVILPPDIYFERGKKDCPAIIKAKNILDNRGNSPRQNKNMLLFMAAKGNSLPELQKTVRRFLAWKKIKDEAQQRNLDTVQLREANNSMAQIETSLKMKLSQTYSAIFAPDAEENNLKDISWEAYEISCNDESNIQKAAEKFYNEELLIRSWGAIHLKQKLSELIWKNSDSTDFKRLWEIFTTYLYMPRLNDSKVLKSTIIKGVQAKDFAIAETFDGEKYQKLKFEETVSDILPSTLIVNPKVAQKQIDSEKLSPPDIIKTSDDEQGSTLPITPTVESLNRGKEPTVKILSKSFSMEVELNPFRINKEISDLMNNILNRLINLSGSQVSLRLEVDIKNENGISKEDEDTVSENCRTSKIKKFQFEK